MEKETKHTPELNEIANRMFKTDYKYIGLDSCKVAVLEELIASAPTLKAENEKLKEEIIRLRNPDTATECPHCFNTVVVYGDHLTKVNEQLQTELSEMKKEREELRQAVEKLHIGLVARGNYDGSVTCKMVEELKTKYKF